MDIAKGVTEEDSVGEVSSASWTNNDALGVLCFCTCSK